jgi:hypothetical protein
MTARRLIAIAVLCFAFGFITGFWLHQPTQSATTPEVLEAMRRIHADAERILHEQRVLIETAPNPPNTSSAPTPPTKGSSR